MAKTRSKTNNNDAHSYSQYYNWIVINNVKCIEWCFPNDVKGDRRKVIKDSVAHENLDTVMLDSRMSKQCKVYCDAIFVSENVSKWLNRMISLYSSRRLEQQTAIIAGGVQYSWSKPDGDIYISACIYDTKNKIMVQPGQRDESNLLSWLDDFTQMKSSEQVISESSQTDQFKSNNCDVSTACTSNSKDTMYKKLVVKFPEENTAATEEGSVHSSDLNGALALSSPVVSELLCYVKYKLCSLPVDKLIAICSSFYSPDTIASSKKLLFDTAQTKQRFRKKIGSNRSKEDLKDIIKVFTEMDPNACGPVFVAQDLGNMPPLTAENDDVLKLHKDIEQLHQVVTNIGVM